MLLLLSLLFWVVVDRRWGWTKDRRPPMIFDRNAVARVAADCFRRLVRSCCVGEVSFGLGLWEWNARKTPPIHMNAALGLNFKIPVVADTQFIETHFHAHTLRYHLRREGFVSRCQPLLVLAFATLERLEKYCCLVVLVHGLGGVKAVVVVAVVVERERFSFATTTTANVEGHSRPHWQRW
jgi:hypothetical protein